MCSKVSNQAASISRASYSPVSDDSIVFSELQSNEAKVLVEKSRSATATPKKKSKKSKSAKTSTAASLPSTPFKSAVYPEMSPAVALLSKALATTSAASSTKKLALPAVERFKNKSKILESNLRKVKLKWERILSSSSKQEPEGDRLSSKILNDLHQAIRQDEMKVNKSKRKQKKAEKILKKELKVNMI